MPLEASESERIKSARRFAVDAARLAVQTHCLNVVILDVRGVSPITDYFLIASGTSTRQMKSVADEISELGGRTGNPPISSDGLEGSSWVLVDFVDVIVHLFTPESRLYYDLDSLWGDAPMVDWNS